MAGTIQAGTLISSNSRSIDVDDIGVRSYAGGGGAFNYRNKIIDGRFDFWYEGTTSATSAYDSSTIWFNWHGYNTKTVTRQNLSLSDLPSIEVPTAKYFHRTVVTSAASSSEVAALVHRIENVKTLAGKKAVLSFYARADSSKSIRAVWVQKFGASGSSDTTGHTTVQLSSGWAKYEVQFDIASVVGKTIGTDGTDRLEILLVYDVGSIYTQLGGSLMQSGTFDIACVQLEEGSVATPFEELPIEISQSRVNRYYNLISLGGDIAASYVTTNTATSQLLHLPQIMRIMPVVTLLSSSNVNIKLITTAGNYASYSVTSLSPAWTSTSGFYFVANYTGSAGYSGYFFLSSLVFAFDARL